jgi:hypothetical protein
MSLRKEVLHRLLLAKSILAGGRNAPSGQPNPHLVARQVLNAHDAADLVFASIADHQRKLGATGKAPSMVECLKLIDSKKSKHEAYFKQLNEARIGLKHVGNLPNTNQWATVAQDVFEKLSSLCQGTLNISLEELDESELLSNGEARAHLLAAKTARASQDFKVALEELAKALFIALEDAPGLGRIEVGRPKAEDALKLTAFGVSANDFLRLQEFLPAVSALPAGEHWQFEIEGVLWKQSGFGHPGNWRDEVAGFCISTCLTVALSVQNAAPVPYAHEFSDVYKYKVTAAKDEVEVWEDLASEKEHAAEVFSSKGRPSRTHKRFLKMGESVIVSPYAHPLVSEDQVASGESIKRVRVSYDPMSGLLPGHFQRAEFVSLADVDITCVPSELYTRWFPALPEIPWVEDPLAFRL